MCTLFNNSTEYISIVAFIISAHSQFRAIELRLLYEFRSKHQINCFCLYNLLKQSNAKNVFPSPEAISSMSRRIETFVI